MRRNRMVVTDSPSRLLLHPFEADDQTNFITHALQHLIHAEIAALDRKSRLHAETHNTLMIRRRPAGRCFGGDRPGLAQQRQITGEL